MKSTMQMTFNNTSLLKEEQLKAQADAEEMAKVRSDPTAHFNKLKAKIKLKTIKMYQEDKER